MTSVARLTTFLLLPALFAAATAVAEVPYAILNPRGDAACADDIARVFTADRPAAVLVPSEELAGAVALYAAECQPAQAACWGRVGIAAGLDAYFIIRADSVSFVDVVAAKALHEPRTFGCTAAGQVMVTPSKYGRLQLIGGPTEAMVFVDDTALPPGVRDLPLSVGEHTFRIEAKTGGVPERTVLIASETTLQVPVDGGDDVDDVPLPMPAAGPHPGLLLSGVGGVVAVGAGIVAGIADVAAAGAIDDIQRTKEPRDDLPAIEAVEVSALILTGIGVVAAGVGLAWWLAAPLDDSTESPSVLPGS